ncbi:MAG: hypothetical protein V1779_17490 [bacterium]
MEKVIHKYKLGEEPKERDYWLNKSPEERLMALEILRQQTYTENDIKQGLQRVVRIIKRSEIDK